MLTKKPVRSEGLKLASNTSLLFYQIMEHEPVFTGGRPSTMVAEHLAET